MAYGRRTSQSSILDTFTLSPLPYPVLLILLVVLLLLGVSWSNTYEEMVENAEEQMSWILLATPVVLVLAIQWLSTTDSFDDGAGIFRWYNNPRRRAYNNGGQQEGSSPWGVAAVVVVLLVMVSFQSTFRDMFFRDMWRT